MFICEMCSSSLFYVFYPLNNCWQIYVLPNMEDMNNACFLILWYFPWDTIWNKSEGLESYRIYTLTRSHTENPQTPVGGMMEYRQSRGEREENNSMKVYFSLKSDNLLSNSLRKCGYKQHAPSSVDMQTLFTPRHGGRGKRWSISTIECTNFV
jgi:hypothetical protein